MIPKRIAVKNFLSFGTTPEGTAVEFLFDDSEPLWVLSGDNGTGKSAVFDAITYALYGTHRGGKTKAEELIRHRTDGFFIEFDFEFNGTDYRITRTRTRARSNNTTQYLFRKVGDEWRGLRDDDTTGAMAARNINDWVMKTLGLTDEAFTNSVLLLQGQADKLFDASRDERIAVLKGIIGFEQYESLAERVNEATKKVRDEMNHHATRRDAIPLVTANEILAAMTHAELTANAVRNAEDALIAANTQLRNSSMWERASAELRELERWIEDAAKREAAGSQIRSDKQTLDDLTQAVPALTDWLNNEDKTTKLQEQHDRAKNLAETKARERDNAANAAKTARDTAEQHKAVVETHNTQITTLTHAIQQDTQSHTEAVEIENLDRALLQYAATLDTDVTAATTRVQAAQAAAQNAANTFTRVKTLLEQAQEQQAQFSNVAIGVNCPHCRQPVNEAHAVTVRAELADRIAKLQQEYESASTEHSAAQKEHNAAVVALNALQQQTRERDKLRTQRDAKRDTLARTFTGTAQELATRIAENTNAKKLAERERKTAQSQYDSAIATAQREETASREFAKEHDIAAAEAAEYEKQRCTLVGRLREIQSRLSEKWQSRLPQITREELKGLNDTITRLTEAGVTKQFTLLQQDVTRREEWARQREQALGVIAEIPDSHRVNQHTAQATVSNCETAAKAAREDDNQARHAIERLRTNQAERERHTQAHREAEERYRLHTRLNTLLGDKGLQLSLVRDAEEQIIHYANDSLQHLSDGDLMLEADPTDDSTKTFDLRARRSGGEPIGVAFLSGSQRFRVAVAIALAVGRFASGRARPLESVIIDEGFGSLDPSGLNAMASELKRLQRTQSLKRVILVSHQPEFAEQFSVGYRLLASPTGTIAERFRR